MPERPLVLFAAPTVADKERRYGGAPKYYFPSHSRQVSFPANKAPDHLPDAL